jgi:hypothetical protein
MYLSLLLAFSCATVGSIATATLATINPEPTTGVDYHVPPLQPRVGVWQSRNLFIRQCELSNFDQEINITNVQTATCTASNGNSYTCGTNQKCVRHHNPSSISSLDLLSTSAPAMTFPTYVPTVRSMLPSLARIANLIRCKSDMLSKLQHLMSLSRRLLWDDMLRRRHLLYFIIHLRATGHYNCAAKSHHY